MRGAESVPVLGVGVGVGCAAAVGMLLRGRESGSCEAETAKPHRNAAKSSPPAAKKIRVGDFETNFLRLT